MKMEPIKCSETSAFSAQTPGRYPKEKALHMKHGESLKSRTCKHTQFLTANLLIVGDKSFWKNDFFQYFIRQSGTLEMRL